MRTISALGALALGGCAGAGADGWTIANGVGLGAQTAALACDWQQTRSYAVDGWRGYAETNPVMGRKPAPGVVDAYFLSIWTASALGWHVLPRRYRFIAPLIVVGIQADTIRHNLTVPSGQASFCGL